MQSVGPPWGPYSSCVGLSAVLALVAAARAGRIVLMVGDCLCFGFRYLSGGLVPKLYATPLLGLQVRASIA